jgi:hypothetical protein
LAEEHNNRSRATEKCIIFPDSKFKTAWNLIIIVLLLYTAIVVPFRIAFVEKSGQVNKIIDICIDVLFGLDILVNFLSAIEDPNTGKIITDRKTIAKTYLKSWFVLDVIACIPFQLIGPSDS